MLRWGSNLLSIVKQCQETVSAIGLCSLPVWVAWSLKLCAPKRNGTLAHPFLKSCKSKGKHSPMLWNHAAITSDAPGIKYSTWKKFTKCCSQKWKEGDTNHSWRIINHLTTILSLLKICWILDRPKRIFSMRREETYLKSERVMWDSVSVQK